MQTAIAELALVPLAPPTSGLATPPPTHERCAAGPGWYDSSWELLRGLDVREGDWLDLGPLGGAVLPRQPRHEPGLALVPFSSNAR